MVTVSIRETYDLSTNTNKMGLLAVHTPSIELLKKLYPGLVLSYKYVRLDSCDVALAAASLLPADPLQVGTEAGEIAPQDLFNPILYRTISTDSFNTMMNRCYALDPLNSLAGGSVSDSGLEGSAAFSTGNTTDVYYSLLSESGWKKAMPQQGLAMRGVVPFVYEVLNSFGNTGGPETFHNATYVPTVNAAGDSAATTINSMTFRGRAHPMPRLPTMKGLTLRNAGLNESDSVVVGPWSIPVGKVFDIPKVPCVAIVMPPAKLHRLYFRMSVVWHVTFSEVASIIERGTVTQMVNAGPYVHTQNYMDTTAKMDDSNMTTKTDMVDTVDVNAEMIMQS